jgi:CheY-like chemotaxis protein
LRLLLVEDEPFIALDLELMASEQGHQVVGVAADSSSALSLAAAHRPDAAFVDINLRDGRTGVEICRRLVAEHGLKAVFITGNAEQAPADLAGALALVEKPYTADLIDAVLGLLQASLSDREPPQGRPGLRLPA